MAETSNTDLAKLFAKMQEDMAALKLQNEEMRLENSNLRSKVEVLSGGNHTEGSQTHGTPHAQDEHTESIPPISNSIGRAPSNGLPIYHVCHGSTV
jgi:hypothetical protein